MKFTPPGGRIEVNVFHNPAGTSVEVTDTGPGIPPDAKQRIFEPFFTTKEVGQGTGLGLAIAHNTVEAMGGKINISSRPGKGTTISMTIPVSVNA